MSKWVQSKYSTEATKWKVADVAYNTIDPPRLDWCVRALLDQGIDRNYFLPKSEYVLCEPPERWHDVTDMVTLEERGRAGPGCKGDATPGAGHFLVEDGRDIAKLICKGTHRIRLVRGGELATYPSAYIVERKLQP